MPAEPRVSVVVPVRDGERFLAEALQSAAAQTPAVYELLVVDDGSADGSAELAERLGARVLRQAREGQAAARNLGVLAATGELVAFLDADDVWPARSLERRLATMRADPSAEVVFGHMREFADGHEDNLGDPRPALLFGSMVVRRSTLERVGPFATEFRVGELMDWLFRAREAGVRELRAEDVVLHRRIHAANTGRDRVSRVDHARIVRRALDRRRGRIRG
jgi:glycosyltransferase involved in cell wall biosynthesis